MDANSQQNKTPPPSFLRLTQEEIDGVEAALHCLLPGVSPLIKLIRMAREDIRMRDALLTVKVNLERQPVEAVPEICKYIDTHIQD